MASNNDFYALKLRVDRDDKSLTEAEIKEYERKRDSKYAEVKYYYSDLLTFINEDLVPDKSTVDLISGLKITHSMRFYQYCICYYIEFWYNQH